jgi:DNA (cytosine-5)-methyltransferase 1
MRLGSFCTGYGGLDMAVEAHYGAHLAWCSEVDKDCNQLLAHHWPGVPNLGDLTAIDWDQVEPVDIMCAGFPCQPFSHAGKRLGGDDERAIFAYIADAVGVLRPGIVVLENVAGLLTLGGPGVIGTLTGLGYDLRWGVVRASDAGAPHRRARWFCVATDSSSERHGGRQNGRVVGLLDSRDESEARQQQRPRAEPVDRDDTATSDTDSSGRGEQRRTITMEPEQRPAQRGRSEAEWGHYAPAIERWERTIGRRAPDPTDDRGLRPGFVEWMMGLPDGHVCDLGMARTAELKMLGNGVVPAQAALALTVFDE